MQRNRALPGLVPQGAYIGWNLECRPRPAEPFTRTLDLISTERGAVALLAPSLCRRPEADRGAARDQRWAIRMLCPFDRGRDGVRVLAVDTLCRPAGRLEALDLIDRVRK